MVRHSQEIHKAASDGKIKEVRDLIEQGVDIEDTYDFIQFTPIECAVVNNHLSIVKLLIEMGANVNKIRCLGTADIELIDFLCFEVNSVWIKILIELKH